MKAEKDTPEIKCPKGEVVCVTILDREQNIVFVITEKPLSDQHTLYEFSGGKLVRLGRGQSPLELEEKYHVKKRMGIQ